jgi:adenosylcobinamide amidohydrolase
MAAATPPKLVVREEDHVRLSTLAWSFGEAMACISSAAIGGGLTEPVWLVNAQVPHGYRRVDLRTHADEIASTLELTGPGVLMLTAVDVQRRESVSLDGVTVTATVGVSDPVWAADTDALVESAPTVGTVNVVVQLPVAHSAAALVNIVATVTEAKCQAFARWPVPGTGTPSDAITVVCPAEGEAEPFGGTRSRWGQPAARAAYDAITAGLPSGYEPKC